MTSLKYDPAAKQTEKTGLTPAKCKKPTGIILKLYDDYNDRLQRFVVRLTGSEEGAEDITHEVYLRLIRHKRKHDLTPSFALLRTIATNIITDLFRKRRVQSKDRHISIEDIEPISSESTPEEIVWNRKTLAKVQRVFDGLNDKSRQAFILHRFSNLTYEQIGEKMGISRSMVQRHISSVLLELSQKIEKDK